jgi:hypothetical protein
MSTPVSAQWRVAWPCGADVQPVGRPVFGSRIQITSVDIERLLAHVEDRTDVACLHRVPLLDGYMLAWVSRRCRWDDAWVTLVRQLGVSLWWVGRGGFGLNARLAGQPP